ncbi:hypothetical protein ACFPIK_10480 [Algoriphagus aquatilis]|uniref:Outer membrane protein beta-barrel domain-containing protein n=1 Tax=Algoriphagus aquatilis TaxID=490186 RepID=A0ABW0BXV8_9BACT
MQLSEYKYKSRFWWPMMIFVGVWFFPQLAQAQRPEKKDYIILGDTALSQGKIFGMPTKENTEVTFARSRRTPSRIYSVAEVSEFRMSERVFFSKKALLGGQERLVFLEKLPHEAGGVSLWRLNAKPAVFFVETVKGLEVLEEDYKETLGTAYGNGNLLPLVAITNKSELSLNYLSKTAKNLSSPRTITKLLTLTPWVAYSSQSVEFLIPDSTVPAKISGSSPSFGVVGELFLTFKRDLSVGLGVTWSQLDNQGFFTYATNQLRYESDVFVDFSLIQVPLTVRYYYDLSPNRYRIFAEAGYSYGMPSYEKAGVFQAEIGTNSIITSSKTFQLTDTYSGFIWGVGVEKYLSKHRGVALGLRHASLGGIDDESFNGFNFYLGFKF